MSNRDAETPTVITVPDMLTKLATDGVVFSGRAAQDVINGGASYRTPSGWFAVSAEPERFARNVVASPQLRAEIELDADQARPRAAQRSGRSLLDAPADAYCVAEAEPPTENMVLVARAMGLASTDVTPSKARPTSTRANLDNTDLVAAAMGLQLKE